MTKNLFSVVIPAEDFNLSIPLSGIDGVAVQKDAEIAFALNETIGADETSRVAFIALATWDESKIGRLDEIRRQIIESGQAFTPDIFLCDGEKRSAALQAVIASGLANLASHQVKRLAEAQALLNSLIDEHASLRKDYASLNQFVEDAGYRRAETVFVSDPESGLAIEVDAPASEDVCLTQLLPVSSQNFSALEIHVPEAIVDDGRSLTLKLVDVDEDRLLAVWRTPKNMLHLGWNRFGLRRVLDGAARTLRLEIGSRFLPPLSLGATAAEACYRVMDKGGPAPTQIAERALAMKVIALAPGAKMPSDAATFLVDAACVNQ